MVKRGKENVQFLEVCLHVHAVSVGGRLVSITYVHHLNQTGAIDGLRAILKDRHGHRGVSLAEFLSLMFTSQHVYLYVIEVEPRNLAVEEEGTAVSIKRKADNINLLGLNSFNNARSNVSLILAQCASHLCVFEIINIIIIFE